MATVASVPDHHHMVWDRLCERQLAYGFLSQSPLDDTLDDRLKNSRKHMLSSTLLIAASKKFAVRKLELVSTFRPTILFAEHVG